MDDARPQTMKECALALARARGVVRTRDFTAAGIARTYIQRLCNEGLLVRAGRGLYQAAEAEIETQHSLVEASRALPHSVVCLLSALQFHGLTTQTPHEVWMMIGSKKWAPRKPPVRLRIIRATGAALTDGVERHEIEGIQVPIYSAAKTVADCFKHRNKVGIDVAIEALRDCLQQRNCTVDDLWRYAKICRVHNVMRPYLEALL
ncbi:MAG: type IV toxin-antitoxin system AbiEi family antitoxin domain-containing protein [Pseudorhodoplanes sp.]